jgi:polysaccharide biosynthesis/export protein
MRNKDVIYVSNSVSVEATKFLTYVRTVNASLNDPINYAISGIALRNIIKTPITTTTTSVFTGSAPFISAPVAP